MSIRLLPRLAALLRRWEVRTRPVDEAAAIAAQRRWDELPEHVRTEAQLVGRRSTGCEGTHGVFPACDLACQPCYHSAGANRVRVDGEHTIHQVTAQMAMLRARRGPAAYAQLIGGEVTLLDPEDHASALQAMWEHGRVPMSMSHGDFDDAYLRRLALRPDGTRRFDTLSFAAHFDTTMRGRREVPRPQREEELDEHRRRFCAMFAALRADTGIRSYLAHNLTVTPENVAEIAGVIRRCRSQGWRMFSFQPAAYLGDERRWSPGYRVMTDDDVWCEIERGAGRRLPYRVLQFGDLRCNRTCWGAFVGNRYVPALEEDDPADLAARDAWLEHLPGTYLTEPSRAVNAVRVARLLLRQPRLIAVGAGWVRRFVRRAGGWWALCRGIRPVTFVMHSFIDAAIVAPAWELLQRGEVAADPVVRAAQERLQACVYSMAHPETGEIVPACAQHAVLDTVEIEQLVELLPRRRAEER